MARDPESSRLVAAPRRRLTWTTIAMLVAPGAIVQGLVSVVQAVTFGALLIGDDRAALTGTLVWMLSVLAGQLAAAAFSRLPCAVGGGAIELLPIFAHLAGSVRERLPNDPDAATATALAGCALLSLALSLWYYVVDRVGGSRALRFFPVSALTGALAGVGVFLAVEAHGTVNGDAAQLSVAAVLALTLAVGEKKTGSTWFVVAVLVASAGLVGVAGVGSDWYWTLPSGGAVATFWARPDAPPRRARWGVLLTMPDLYVSALSAIFVHQLSTCMDLVNLAGTGAKTAAGDGDLVKAELRTFAAQNLVAGLLCAPPNYMPFSALYAQHRAARAFPKRGVPPRAAPCAVLVAMCCGAAALPYVAAMAPRCVVAAYLLWLAWLFLEESIVAALFRDVPHPLDLLVILVVPVLTLSCGFVIGLGLGIVLSSIGLVVRIGSTPAARAVRLVLTGAEISSNLHRDAEAAMRLAETADRRLVVKLQGLLSFATTPGLLDDVSAALGGTKSLDETDEFAAALGRMAGSDAARVVVVLDFSRVSDVDASAARGLLALKRIAHHDHAAVLLVSAAPDASARALARSGFFDADDDPRSSTPRAFEFLYKALEHAESLHLSRSALRLPPPSASPAETIRRTFAATSDEETLELLEAAFEVVALAAGETIWRAGDPSEGGIALVCRGRLRTLLRSRPSADWPSGHDREVEPSGPGSLHGYLSAFTGQPRHATFEAVTDAQILVLSTEKLGALPPAAALAVARTTMARSSDEYRHHTAVVANLMQ